MLFAGLQSKSELLLHVQGLPNGFVLQRRPLQSRYVQSSVHLLCDTINGETSRFVAFKVEFPKFCQNFDELSGGHVYNMAKNLNRKEFTTLKTHTIFLCEQFLNRSLQAFEKEIFLFPRLCHDENCREWRPNLLSDCKKCGQVCKIIFEAFEFVVNLMHRCAGFILSNAPFVT